jgi:hypothetical protein
MRRLSGISIKRVALIGIAISAGHPMPATAADQPAQFDGRNLKPYANSWKYDVILPDGTRRPQGIWTDQVLPCSRNGKDVLCRVQGTVLINGSASTVVNAFDPATMLPISDQRTLKGGGLQKRSFSIGSVQSTRTPAGGKDPVSSVTPVSGAIYDYYGGMYALLLATAPLREGYSSSFTSIDEFTDDPIQVDFKVVGRERVSAGSSGFVNAWKVLANRPGQYSLTGWVIQRPPYVIRLVILLPDKRVYDWTMV